MKMLKENRAQGSIEVLLLIGGATLVATIIGIVIKSLAQAPSNEVTQEVQEAQQSLQP